MERLTEKRNTPLVMSMWIGDSQSLRIYNRLAAIEDIMGDDYDLDRLRELVEADREGRCVVFRPGYDTDEELEIIKRIADDHERRWNE